MRKTLKSVITAVMALALTITAVPADLASAAEANATAVEAGKAAFDASGSKEYNAYLTFQVDQSWVFRDPMSSKETGIEFENFGNVLTTLNVDEPQIVDGTVTDTKIKGNGTYTVKIEGMNGCAASEATAALKYVGFSTDIPANSGVQITNVKLKIDGMTKLEQPTAIIDDEEAAGTITVLCNNLYRNTEELKTELQVPNDSIEITFDVAGFDVDNPDAVEATEAPAEAASDSADESSGISIPVVVGIVVVAVVVIGAVVVVVSKKKK